MKSANTKGGFLKNIKIKTRIRLILIGMCISILLIFLVVCFYFVRKDILDLVIKGYEEVAVKQFEYIENWTENTIEYIEKIAQTPAVVSALAENSGNNEISKTRKDELVYDVDDFLKYHDIYIKMGVVDTNGDILYYSDGQKGNISGSRIFQQIKGSKDIFIAGAYKDVTGGNPHLCQPVSYPVYEGLNEKGKITGYVITHINLDILDDSISVIDLGKGGCAYVIGKDGSVICSSDHYEWKGDQEIINYKLTDISKKKLVYGVEECLKTNHSGNGVYFNHLGEEVIGIWKWYGYFEWCCLIEVNKEVSLAPVYKTAFIILIIGVGLSIITILISIYLSKKIIDPVARLNDSMRDISEGEGDLTQQLVIETKDELGDTALSFNTFTEKIRGIVGDVKNAAKQLNVYTNEMSGKSELFSENAQNEAASAEEITATIEEVSSGIESISFGAEEQDRKLTELISNIQELSAIIKEMSSLVTEGTSLSESILVKVKSGEEALNLMSSGMAKINESSGKIEDIVKIINNVSDQINLLSLNATIEAARAGEAGRGFGVVASEISKLADETASSLKDIDMLIKANNKEIGTGMGNVQSVVEDINSIIEGVVTIGDIIVNVFKAMKKQLEINNIVNKEADEVKVRSDEIRNATGEQKIAVEEIVKSISKVNDLIQSSATASEELSGLSEEISGLSNLLKDKVGFFKV